MTEESFHEQARQLIEGTNARIWLTRLREHRLDFVFSVGGEQLTPIVRLVRRGDYILLGQRVPEEWTARLQGMVDAFAETEGAPGAGMASPAA